MVEGKVLEEIREFLKSRVILTAAELDLFTRLEEQEADAGKLAKELKLQERPLIRLLDCLVALELLSKGEGGYRLTERGSLLSSNHPGTELPMALHLNELWETWSGLTETVRTGANPRRKPLKERSKESTDAFIGAMHVAGRQLAREISNGYDLSPFRRLLDIGGASGTYTAAFLEKNPRMTAVLFDLPSVIPLAERRLGEEGLLERVELITGDFQKEELPGGCDLALLSAIIHQNSPDENVTLYKKIFRALLPKGKVLIRDHVMDPSRTYPKAGTLFAINMLVNTRGGDTYTFEEVKRGLETAGFEQVKMMRKGERMDCLVEGSKT
jgi:SAM-dependent methyltransferase